MAAKRTMFAVILAPSNWRPRVAPVRFGRTLCGCDFDQVPPYYGRVTDAATVGSERARDRDTVPDMSGTAISGRRLLTAALTTSFALTATACSGGETSGTDAAAYDNAEVLAEMTDAVA